jgi:hypothetical protein
MASDRMLPQERAADCYRRDSCHVDAQMAQNLALLAHFSAPYSLFARQGSTILVFVNTTIEGQHEPL